MKKIKKIIAGLLALSLVFLCTACAGQSEQGEENSTKQELTENDKSNEESIDDSNDKNSYEPNSDNNYIEPTIDPYNGLPAPVELKLVNSNGKKAMGNDTGYSMDFSMYMIEDYHGLKYLVLTCSATSNYSDRKVTGPDFSPVVKSKANVSLSSLYDLEKEVRQAYDEIIFSGFMETTLYPGETIKDSRIYDFYGEKSNITVILQPTLRGNVVNGSNNNYIHGIYTGDYSYDESYWDEYIFLEFSF